MPRGLTRAEVEEIPTAVDLWARRPGDGVLAIFEAKTITLDNQIGQTRSALSQLLEYRHFYGAPEDKLCLVTNAPIADQRQRFLSSEGVGVCCLDGNTLQGAGTLAAGMLREVLG